ncbi:MAG: tail fiber domain-containing protein, partial [Terriglobales bacterium]
LRGVSYDLKDSGKHEIGVIAEEVGAVVPEVVSYDANGKDASGVDYSRLTALLIEAVKQQQVQIARQAKQIAAQHEQIRRLRSKDTVLESKLTQLQRNIDQRKQIRTPISQLARNQAVSGTARF